MDTDTKYIFGSYLFVFLFISTMGVVAASGWRISVSPSAHVQSTTLQEIKPDEIEVTKAASVEEDKTAQKESVQKPAVSTRQVTQSVEPDDSISKEEQAKLDEFERQAKEYNKQLKDGLANLKKTLSEQTVTPPPAPKPLPTVKAPEPIKVEPKPLQPTEICRSWTETPYGKTCSRTEIIFK